MLNWRSRGNFSAANKRILGCTCMKFNKNYGRRLYPSTVCKSRYHMGNTQQKHSFTTFWLLQSKVHGRNINLWLQYVGMDWWNCDQHNCRRKYSYSIRNITLQDHRILVHSTRCSTISIMSLEGSYSTGTVNSERFTTETLPILKPLDGNDSLSIVIMDNASIELFQHVTKIMYSNWLAHAEVVLVHKVAMMICVFVDCSMQSEQDKGISFMETRQLEGKVLDTSWSCH